MRNRLAKTDFNAHGISGARCVINPSSGAENSDSKSPSLRASVKAAACVIAVLVLGMLLWPPATLKETSTLR